MRIVSILIYRYGEVKMYDSYRPIVFESSVHSSQSSGGWIGFTNDNT